MLQFAGRPEDFFNRTATFLPSAPGRSVLLFALHAKGQTQRIFAKLEEQLTEESDAQ